jgi:hypothetical protein
MARSDITGKTVDLISDDGAVLFSIAQGEQLHFSVTLDWLTDLTGYTITAKVVEALNVLGDGASAPVLEAITPQITTLTIIDNTVSDNEFKIVLPDDLATNWDVQPSPNDPVYGYFALSVADTGTGDEQQIFVPLRGLIEVRYNPVEVTS